MKEYGLKEPVIEADEHWFTVTFHRQRAEQKPSNQTTHEPATGVKTSMKPRVKTGEKILALIKEHPEITRVQIAEMTGISLKGVDWQLARMKARGLLGRIIKLSWNSLIHSRELF
jgi:ATP-dependent DNA helicase RecG